MNNLSRARVGRRRPLLPQWRRGGRPLLRRSEALGRAIAVSKLGGISSGRSGYILPEAAQLARHRRLIPNVVAFVVAAATAACALRLQPR